MVTIGSQRRHCCSFLNFHSTMDIHSIIWFAAVFAASACAIGCLDAGAACNSSSLDGPYCNWDADCVNGTCYSPKVGDPCQFECNGNTAYPLICSVRDGTNLTSPKYCLLHGMFIAGEACDSKNRDFVNGGCVAGSNDIE